MDRYKRYSPCYVRQGIKRCEGVTPRNGEYCVCTDQPISLAMAYVSIQEFKDVLSCSEGLESGTVFVELIKPVCSGGCRR